MINSIAELGRFEKNKNPDLTSFDIWLEDSVDNGNYPNLFLIEFIKADSKWTFGRIDVWQNSSNLKSKLLYKFGSPGGPNITPTSKVTKSIEVTIPRKIINWFESNKNKKFLSTEESKQGYKYSSTFKKYSFSKNETCSVCNKVKEVFGFFTSLAFYTVDKPGMVTGGFQQDKSWKIILFAWIALLPHTKNDNEKSK